MINKILVYNKEKMVMSKFEKISKLTPEDKSKVRSYWEQLYGGEYANAMVTDFKPDGDQKKAEASSKNKK